MRQSRDWLVPEETKDQELKAAAEEHPLSSSSEAYCVELAYDPSGFVITTLKVTSADRADMPPLLDTPGHVLQHRLFSDWTPRKRNPLDYTIENLWWIVMQKVIEARYPDPDREPAPS